jgi:hypothetical protein
MIGYPSGVGASGDAPGASMFSFSGFGTLGAVHSNEDHADFTSVLKPNGAGYTHQWSTDVDSRIAGRPPEEIYSLAPVNDSDGVDASYRLLIGSFVHVFSASYGRSHIKVPGGVSADVRRLWIISDSAEYGAATVHLSFAQGRFTFNQDDLETLFDAFRHFGPQGSALANRYDVDDKRVQFIGLGAVYDPGGWFVMGKKGSQFCIWQEYCLARQRRLPRGAAPEARRDQVRSRADHSAGSAPAGAALLRVLQGGEERDRPLATLAAAA